MLIKVTSKRQVTFPAAVLEALGAAPGTHLLPRADGFLLRARGIDRSKLAPLRGMIAKGTKPFDVEAFREQAMNHRYGIDTSVFVRLLTGDPDSDYLRTVRAFEKRLESGPQAEFFVSNQVIGEAYIALQHHYSVAEDAAKAALQDVLTSGLCSPLNGASVLAALREEAGCGLLDRLIADDYATRGMKALTNDRKMAALPEA